MYDILFLEGEKQSLERAFYDEKKIKDLEMTIKDFKKSVKDFETSIKDLMKKYESTFEIQKDIIYNLRLAVESYKSSMSFRVGHAILLIPRLILKPFRRR